MLRINQIKLPVFAVSGEKNGTDPKKEAALLKKKAAALLKVKEESVRKLKIIRRSIDARDKSAILFVYTVDVRLSDSVIGPNSRTEADFVKRLRNRNITQETGLLLQLPVLSEEAKKKLSEDGMRPLVVGTGPCGLFAAHTLAKAGLKPLVIERGEPVDARSRTVDAFFETGILDPESNVQFGEGGAGTFSDGKLNTSVKGQGSYIRYVLETFRAFGAGTEILCDQKPHIGTDVLTEVVRNMREECIRLGAEFLFGTKLCGLEVTEGRLSAAVLCQSGKRQLREHVERLRALCTEAFEYGEAHYRLPVSELILAVGHSARDTFSMLYETGLSMEQKPFAMGVRVQHPQELIDRALYGEEALSEKQRILGPASYKLTHRCADGRSIYSFCMCPGGYVVNASSEEGRLCINGMSRQKRDSGHANSALIVNIRTEDFPDGHPLSGMTLQRELEARAYRLCGGAIPTESYGDFKRGETNPSALKDFSPEFQGYYGLADIRSMLPQFMQDAIIEGMEAFSGTIKDFNSEDAVLSAIEARTSSPLRIVRDESGEANIRGIYPAGEGAGYAGGITSAAVDGIRAAANVIASYERM